MGRVWKVGDKPTIKELNELQEKADKWDAYITSNKTTKTAQHLGEETTTQVVEPFEKKQKK